MSTVRPATTTAGGAATARLWTNRALESLWLLTVVLVPLVFLGRRYGEWSSIIGSFELPKIVLLRTLVGLMAALWLAEWGLQPGSLSRFALSSEGILRRPGAWFAGLWSWLRAHPKRWLTLAVALYLGSTLLSTVLSASFSVSMWGDVPGQDSYGTYTVTAYVLLFGVLATHMRTRGQLWRLLGAIAAMGVLVAGYAVLQHYGHDFLDLMEPPNTIRVSSTMGNATFAGAVLLMTIPVSLALAAVTSQEPLNTLGSWWKLGLWTVVLTVQLLGMAFTLTRGPWFAATLAVVGFLGVTGVLVGLRYLARAALALGFAVALTAAILSLTSGASQPTTATAASVVADRITAVGRHTASGGLGGRVTIWRGSWTLITDRPWFGFDALSLSPLRPVIGYGPDFFRGTYLLESPPGFRMLPSEHDNAHNILIHQGVEVGFLGALVSLSLFMALFVVGAYLLFRGRRGYSNGHKLMLAALLATLAGWLLGQMLGVPRVSDLTISWVLLGTFAALPVVMGDQLEPGDLARSPGPQRRLRRNTSRPWRKRELGTWPLLSLLAAACLVAGIGALTWTKSINYFRAGIIVDRGAQQFRDGRLQEALSSLDRAIDLAPDVSSYYVSRATVYWACRQNSGGQTGVDAGNGDGERSRELCQPEAQHLRNQQWVQRRPFDFRSRLALADSALDLGSLRGDAGLLAQSTRLYREAAEMLPSSWPLWNRLAEVYIQLDQPGSALSPLEKSLEITGDAEPSYEALLLQATAYRNLDQPEKAITSLSRAILSRPGSAEAYYIRGTSYYELGQLRKAMQDLDQAIVLNPEHGLAYNNRGLIYARMGRLDVALQDFDRAVQLNPQFAVAYNNRGFANRDLGDTGRALEDLNRAIELDPDFAMAYYNRALTHTLLGDDPAAEGDMNRAVELGFDRSLAESAVLELRNLR